MVRTFFKTCFGVVWTCCCQVDVSNEDAIDASNIEEPLDNNGDDSSSSNSGSGGDVWHFKSEDSSSGAAAEGSEFNESTEAADSAQLNCFRACSAHDVMQSCCVMQS